KGVVVFSCVLTLAGALVAIVVVQLAAWSAAWIAGEEEFSYLACTGLLAATFALSDLIASILRARGSVGWALLPRDVVWRIFLIGTAGMASLSAISLSADTAILLAAVTLGLVMVVQAFHAWRSLRNVLAARAAFACRHWLTTALPMWGSAVLFALVQQSDVVVVSMLMSPEEAGRYFAAMRTASLLGLLLVAGNIVSAPVISRLFHAGDHAGLERFCRLSATCLGVPALLGFLFLVVAGRDMLAVFDPAIVDAYPALVVLAAGFAFDAASGPTGYFQQMIGRENAYFRTMLATFALVLPAQLVLTPAFGLLGAAVPSAVGAVAWNVVAIRRLRSEYGLDCSLLGLLWWPRPREHAWRTT
ncbi:MAG TPA: polysaccharide biosynthesis C-terminal domain-containing protein, partial [Aestuariivirgaceae bacterium]|nr:polysaccharide biosynthesis C-terminal domain-containing protein [Aestuariivirgaceae bacterium]